MVNVNTSSVKDVVVENEVNKKEDNNMSEDLLDDKAVKNIVIDELDSEKGKHIDDLKEDILCQYADCLDEEDAEAILNTYVSEKEYGNYGAAGAMNLVLDNYDVDESMNLASAGQVWHIVLDIMFDEVMIKLLKKAGLKDSIVLNDKNIKALKNASKSVLTKDPKHYAVSEKGCIDKDSVFDCADVDDFIDNNCEYSQTIGDVRSTIDDYERFRDGGDVDAIDELNEYGVFNAVQTIKDYYKTSEYADSEYNYDDMLSVYDEVLDHLDPVSLKSIANELYRVILKGQLDDEIDDAYDNAMTYDDWDDDTSLDLLHEYAA